MAGLIADRDTKEYITVQVNDSSFEYDVRSLLRAFFPGADVEFLQSPSDGLEEKKDADLGAHDDVNGGSVDLVIRISDNLISQVWRGGEEKVVSVEGLARTGVKNALKCLIYDTLSVDLGRELPWGTLTGIRPTKLVLKKMREGDSFAEIEKFMRENYRASKEKTKLAYRIAVREERIIRECAAESMGMEPYYLYRQKDIAGNLENVGFAPEGKEGLYNILIMEEVQDIVALGAGAISKRIGRQDMGWMKADGLDGRVSDRPPKTVRAANVKDVEQYIERVDEMIERKRKLWKL